LFACGALEGPSTPTREVQLSTADESLYWVEVERRISTWFRNGGVPAPTLLPAETVYTKVHFLEVPHENLETCTFSKSTLDIRVGDDKWDGGCVPHELGHAVLWLLHNPCWDKFEHPNERPDQC